MYDRIQGVLEEPIGEGMHVRIPWFQVRLGRDGCLEHCACRLPWWQSMSVLLFMSSSTPEAHGAAACRRSASVHSR